jgi:L-lactate dehydrogenase complex protein LldG
MSDFHASDSRASDARTRILSRLRAAAPSAVPDLPEWTPPSYEPAWRLERFRTMFEAMKAEVHDVDAATWPQRLRTLLDNRGVRSVLHGDGSSVGTQLASAWSGDPQAPRLVAYGKAAEEFKDDLVHGIDAGITWASAGIAETGSLILWPTTREPRLMSLLPPIHIALVEEDSIRDNLPQLMVAQGWARRMPTNIVVVSGPSKTADIEQTLAFGVHGPKELIVLVLRKPKTVG